MTDLKLPPLEACWRDPTIPGWPAKSYYSDAVEARERILLAEIERLRQAPPVAAVPDEARDAARYRWLVDSGTDTYSMFVEAESKAELDAEIDAAMLSAQEAARG